MKKWAIRFSFLGKEFKTTIKAENEAIARAKLLKEIEKKIVIKSMEDTTHDEAFGQLFNQIFGKK